MPCITWSDTFQIIIVRIVFGFFWKVEAVNFDSTFTNQDAFKSFKHKMKIFGKAIVQLDVKAANEILENATIAISSKDLRNFCRASEMLSIYCKVEQKRLKICKMDKQLFGNNQNIS